MIPLRLPLLALAGLFGFEPQASTPLQEEAAPEATPAPSAEHASIDNLILAVYEIISGPVGARDWERFGALFHPQLGRLMPVRSDATPARLQSMNPEEYSARVGTWFEENGFFEREVARRVEEFGHIAHVFSTYEARRALDDEAPFERGINSFQLFHDGERWWILSILWNAETPARPLPEKYLSR